MKERPDLKKGMKIVSESLQAAEKTTVEEIKEALDDLAKNWDQVPKEGALRAITEITETFLELDAEHEELKRQTRWRSVKKGLPKEDGDYLCRVNIVRHRKSRGYKYSVVVFKSDGAGKGTWYHEEHELYNFEVTHYQKFAEVTK